MSFLLKEKTGVLVSRISNDVTIISDSLSNNLRVTIINIFILITHISLLFFISYQLVTICLVIVPAILWPINHFARKIKNATNNEQSYLGELNSHIHEIIGGMRVVRAFGMKNSKRKHFESINNTILKEAKKNRISHVISPAIVEFFTSLIIFFILLYGANQILLNQLAPGSFFTFLITLILIISPIKQVATWFNNAARTGAAGKRVFEILSIQEEIKYAQNNTNSRKVESIQKQIEIKNISFKYPNTKDNVLNNINLTVPAGSTVALVGQSGSGKSTLMDLLARFYEIEKGCILLDGVDINKIYLKSLRQLIGIVTQEIFLFNGTIRENLCYGRTDVTDEKLQKISKMAHADIFINELPNKYDTVIGERGLMLSGGQRQRLSIARAMLKDPCILILDEATNALDSKSEKLVQNALSVLMKNRTTFVIAHRLSTIYEANQIVVMEKGNIIEIGDHQSLLKNKGRYKQLFDLQ